MQQATREEATLAEIKEQVLEEIAAELPLALQNKYFEYQTQLCHGYENAPDPPFGNAPMDFW